MSQANQEFGPWYKSPYMKHCIETLPVQCCMLNQFVCPNTSTSHHGLQQLGVQQVHSYIGIYESNEEAYEIEVTLF
jgi:hypothetical protein